MSSIIGLPGDVGPEAAAIDTVAERRALDLQQPGGFRLVALGHLERPADQARLDPAQPIVERERRRLLHVCSFHCSQHDETLWRLPNATVMPVRISASPCGISKTR